LPLPSPLLLPPWFWLQKFPVGAERVNTGTEEQGPKRAAKGQVQGCPFVTCPPPSGVSKACACTWHHLMLRRLQKCFSPQVRPNLMRPHRVTDCHSDRARDNMESRECPVARRRACFQSANGQTFQDRLRDRESAGLTYTLVRYITGLLI
jgi:hypothetical protein